jgi:hypothetical protein
MIVCRAAAASAGASQEPLIESITPGTLLMSFPILVCAVKRAELYAHGRILVVPLLRS